MPRQLKVERSSREVIEGKLLASLEDGTGHVAIVCTKDDLDMLISVLAVRVSDRPRQFRADLVRLRREAFGA